MNNGKKWSICFLVLILLGLIFVGVLTVVIDPFFHYHAPLEGLAYPIEQQRYQNDGIVRHFTYDAIITGSSMTENFKTSECNRLFGVNAVKTSFSGASSKEISNLLDRAFEANPDIKLVIRGIDGWTLTDHKDYLREDLKTTEYLYDDSLINDVGYIFNKDILFEYTIGVLKHTASGAATTTFDEYSNWHASACYGLEAVKETYKRPDKSDTVAVLTEEEAQTVRESVLQNLVRHARNNPDTQFYYFFTPYNIMHMDRQNRQGILNRQFQIYVLTSQLLLEEENIHLFSFFDDYATITNLDHYKDVSHYSEEINSQILQRMHAGEYRLTKDNYLQHWSEVEAYYESYDFEAFFEES